MLTLSKIIRHLPIASMSQPIHALTNFPARIPQVSMPSGGRSVLALATFSNSDTSVEGSTTVLFKAKSLRGTDSKSKRFVNSPQFAQIREETCIFSLSGRYGIGGGADDSPPLHHPPLEKMAPLWLLCYYGRYVNYGTCIRYGSYGSYAVTVIMGIMVTTAYQ